MKQEIFMLTLTAGRAVWLVLPSGVRVEIRPVTTRS